VGECNAGGGRIKSGLRTAKIDRVPAEAPIEPVNGLVESGARGFQIGQVPGDIIRGGEMAEGDAHPQRRRRIRWIPLPKQRG
jgi:hypothetical protein